jgi:predicted CopG family antitoxin
MFNMVVKTLTVTEKAYEFLRRAKKGDESFSEVIVRISNKEKGNIIGFYGMLKDSRKELDGMKKKIKKRKKEINKESRSRENKLRKRK